MHEPDEANVTLKLEEYAFGMGSKDHYQWPKDDLNIQISPGRQLRSRFFLLCPNCDRPIHGKSDQQNVCKCLSSTPNPVDSDTTSLTNQSKKKNRKTIQLPASSCKRQLFNIGYEHLESTSISPDAQESIAATTGSGDSNLSIHESQERSPEMGQILKGEHMCQVCSKSLTSPSKLTQHSYSHTGEEPFVCKFDISYEHSVSTSISPDAQESITATTGSGNSNLSIHESISPDVQEPIAATTESGDSNLSIYESFSPDAQEPIAAIIGSGDSNLSIHESQERSPEIGQILRGRHMCQVCSKTFTSPCKLTQHSYSHTGEKPFVCKHCSKAFSSKFKLVRHVLIHSDQRQYCCTICDRTFHRKDHLKNHAKVHNPIKRTLQCDRTGCSKEYSSILSYRKHIAVHSVEEGFLDCKICSKIFERKDELMYHLKIHSGSRVVKTPADKKYECHVCDRKFYTSKDVRRHLVVHTGLRDFLCQFCPQRFGRKDHLTRHIKKSHNINTISKKYKPKKQNEVKSQTAESVYLETYNSTVIKIENKPSETVTSGSLLIKQEHSPMSELQVFHSFNYDDNNINATESSSEPNLSHMYEHEVYQVDDELKVFETTALTNQLTEHHYQESTSPEMSGLSQLIGLIPSSGITSIDSNSSMLTNQNETNILNPQQSHQHVVSQDQTQMQVGEYFTSSEILSALLRETSEASNTTTLPGFNQIFNQQQ